MLTCANPACARPLTGSGRHASANLCGGCGKHWDRWSVPTAGFISSLDLQGVARELLAEMTPTKAEIVAALRIMRGSRHREGPWGERPAYRVAPLLHGRVHRRLPHLLVGRRREPSKLGLAMALAHYLLANRVIGTKGTYSQFLAGATWYNRRSPSAPKGGEDVLKGEAKTAGYRLHVNDFSAIGREVLRASAALGLDPRSGGVADRITAIYHEGLAAGRYHRPVVVPYGSFPTTAPGDHPLDFRMMPSPAVPRRYHQVIRRASGRIAGEWPKCLDLSWDEQVAAAQRSRPHSLNTLTITDEVPDTGWLFGS